MDLSQLGKRTGRPRSPRADRVILEATLSQLAEAGLGGLSIDGVAARAGVGKGTIYRRWKTKSDLVVAAMKVLVEEAIPAPDTGDTRRDLELLVRRAIRTIAGAHGGRILAHLAFEGRGDPRLEEALRGFWTARRARTFQVLARGVERGELPPDLDPGVTVDLLYGPVYSRLLAADPLDERLARRIVEAVLGAAGERRRARQALLA